jgi:hypothetical protein
MLIAMLLFMRRVAETTKVSVTKEVVDLSDEGEIMHDDSVLVLPQVLRYMKLMVRSFLE